MPVGSDSVRVWTKTLSENRARKSHRVEGIPRANGHSRVEHSAKLNARDYLVPRVKRWRCCIIPRGISINKNATRIAKRQLHNWVAQPFWALERITQKPLALRMRWRQPQKQPQICRVLGGTRFSSFRSASVKALGEAAIIYIETTPKSRLLP